MIEYTPERVRKALRKTPGVKVLDDPDSLGFPQPIEVSGGELVHVGRIREDSSNENGLTCSW